MRSSIALLAVAFLAVSVLGQDSCNAWTSCSSCTTQGPCGWCSYSGTCESGNGTGSFVGCTTPYWSWTSNTCPATPAPTQDPCNAWTSCSTCTMQGRCGWCSYSGTCESGNGTGSFVGCTTPYWSWTSSSCPATPAPTPLNTCSAYASCASCTVVGGCGWCAFTEKCEAGNSTGSSVGCVAPYWSWTSNTCPTPAPPSTSNCGQASNCNACTSMGPCGWCAFTNRCENGNATGSIEGCVAPYWSWTQSQCQQGTTMAPAPVDVCNQYSGNCGSCTAHGTCGYCLPTQACQTGTGSGSTNGTCSGSSWAWVSSQCNSTAQSKH